MAVASQQMTCMVGTSYSYLSDENRDTKFSCSEGKALRAKMLERSSREHISLPYHISVTESDEADEFTVCHVNYSIRPKAEDRAF